MRSFGSRLREERERQGLSLEEISTQTKIRQSYLEAIEKDSLETMPGGFFSRSFVRQYAHALGLRAEEVENQLDAVTVPPGDTVRIDKIFEDYRPTKGQSTKTPDEDTESEFFHEAAFLNDSRPSASWVLLAAALITASVVYLTWQRKPELFENVFAKTVSATAKIETTAITPQQEHATSPATPSAPVQEVAPTPVATPEAVTTTTIQVAVVATEPSWVRLNSDGARVFNGLMQAGETRNLSGLESAMVFTGNAGGLELIYNGKAIGAPGPKGQVRTVVFTAQNWEVKNQQQKKVEAPDRTQAEPDAVHEP